MKTRTGFVSNSSSSSFVAVGIRRRGSSNDEKRFKKLLDSMDVPSDEYDWEDSRIQKLKDVGYGEYEMVDGSEIHLYGGYEINTIGFDAAEYLENDWTLSEIKEEFINTIKKHYKMSIPETSVKLIVDKVSSE